jgi:hypothetical protein
VLTTAAAALRRARKSGIANSSKGSTIMESFELDGGGSFETLEDAVAWVREHRGGNGSINRFSEGMILSGQRVAGPITKWEVREGVLTRISSP